jgi:hypothetical protein
MVAESSSPHWQAPPPVTILSQMNAIHSCPSYFLSTYFNIIIPSTSRSSSCSISFRFPHQPLYAPFLSHIRATCLAHLISLDLITLTTFGDQYRSQSSPLCSPLHSPVTSSLSGPNILLSTLSSDTLVLRSSFSASLDKLYMSVNKFFNFRDN